MHIQLDKQQGTITIKDGTRTTYFILKALMVLNMMNAGLFLYKGSRTGFGFIEGLWIFLAVVSLIVLVYLVYRKSTQAELSLDQIVAYRAKNLFGRKQYALKLRNGKFRDLGTFKATEDQARFRGLMAEAGIPEQSKP